MTQTQFDSFKAEVAKLLPPCWTASEACGLSIVSGATSASFVMCSTEVPDDCRFSGGRNSTDAERTARREKRIAWRTATKAVGEAIAERVRAEVKGVRKVVVENATIYVYPKG